ncbi:ABC transporter permease [Gluconobacter wancherniae]|uniref:Peptide ABC transporter permease n=1 Tax=Gluconobacter wancherniae NBRC 103581 TaxID=656744 RepID=A0A511B3A9_9PROT|nr:ABC transporter permease [Gluconobacter wancherniae]GBD56805.1 peptide ABC transporter permease [Gluconobacter wancherniae NBRC 103581]GBR64579.1 peptide ABC transporter permease [Gluconobacter wancherniae NBRC 103581]GEK92287.1 peptide ABC transporter permease [Gluconobacter wancherniae NBRC 103581]
MLKDRSLRWLDGLRARKGTVAALFLLAGIVLASLSAPLYAAMVGVDPFASDLAGTTQRGGQTVDLMQPNDNPLHLGLTPLGPDWQPGPYALGSDSQGRDVAARVLYGGRNSLLIAATASLLCLTLAGMIGICAGYFGGWVDIILSRILDIMWAIPVYLFAISLSVVTVGHGLRLGPFVIGADSLLIPIVIIALVYVPYAARPLRARALSLAQAEFVMAARGMGASHGRIVLREILPNLATTMVVLGPLVMALCLLAESALSFLSLGVQAPAASWGSIIQDGEGLLYTRPAVAIVPGIAIVLTVLALNVLGNSLRDHLDPKGAGR